MEVWYISITSAPLVEKAGVNAAFTQNIEEYDRIVNLVVGPGCIAQKQIKNILSIANGALESKWTEYNEKLPTRNIQYLLHSSKYECDLGLNGKLELCKSISCVCSLLQKGHLLAYATGGNFGKGLYFADQMQPAMFVYQQHNCRDEYCLIVITKIALGKIADVNNNTQLKHLMESARPRVCDNLLAPPNGYDSIKNFWEHVVYNEAATLPSYAVIWKPRYFQDWKGNQTVDLKKMDEGEAIVIYERKPEKEENNTSGAFTIVKLESGKNYRFTVKGVSSGAPAALWVRISNSDSDTVWSSGKFALPSEGKPAWQSCEFNTGTQTEFNIGVLFSKSSYRECSMRLLAYKIYPI